MQKLIESGDGVLSQSGGANHRNKRNNTKGIGESASAYRTVKGEAPKKKDEDNCKHNTV